MRQFCKHVRTDLYKFLIRPKKKTRRNQSNILRNANLYSKYITCKIIWIALAWWSKTTRRSIHITLMFWNHTDATLDMHTIMVAFRNKLGDPTKILWWFFSLFALSITFSYISNIADSQIARPQNLVIIWLDIRICRGVKSSTYLNMQHCNVHVLSY